MTSMTVSKPSLASTKRSYRAWSVRTVVVQLSRKLKATYRIRSERSLSHLLVALLAVVSPWAVADLPTGLNVVAGQASVSTPTANNMRINQATDKAVLNWQTFNIGVGQAVQFVQPATTSVALNRIVGNEASSIYGSLSANGQVFLINPAGVMFAPGAQVSVGGLVASSLAISNDDFLAGRYTFSGIGGGPVDNHGTITAARGGYVLLAAPKAGNTGAITADAGSVGLLAGSRVTLDTSGVGLVRFSVDAAAANAAITNSGSITASGGQVAVLASAVGDALATVINQTGVIRADSAVERNGMIVLSGGQTGVVRVAGTLSATGTADGQAGGTVQVLGDKVLLAPGASIDASGQSGGGTVLVGGDYQGSNANVQNASRVYVAAGTNVNADATVNGNGGKVVVWADGDTRFAGSISARGGAQGGNGGFVEVSGKRDLDVQGRVDVGAPQGMGGKVMFDPENIQLVTTTPTGIPPNNAPGTPDLAFADPPSPGTYAVRIADVVGYSELFLQASNDITVSSALAMGAGNSIRLEAKNNIVVGANVSVTGAGSINFRADADGNGAGNVQLNNVALLSQAGGITLRGASISGTGALSTITSTGGANGNAGNISITADTGNVSLAAAVTANGGTTTSIGRNAGNVSMSAQTGFATTAGITANGTAGAAGNNAGGSAGVISITNATSGSISTGALTTQTGASTGTAAAGAAGSITVTNSATGVATTLGNMNTAGLANGNGGAVTITTTGTLSAGTIATGGGTALAGTSGRNAGAVTVNASGAITALGIVTASGSAGVLTGDQSGGNGAVVGITAVGGISAVAMTASGGGAVGTNANGGNAGTITVSNSGTGNITTGALAASTGAAIGTGTVTAGSISVTNTAAAGNLTTAALTTTGGTFGHGGAVTLSALGTVATGGAAITTSGGTTLTGNVGRNAGTVSITGAGLTLGASTLTASGSAGIGTDQKGGNGAAISLTSTAGMTGTGAIIASGGAGSAANGAGGNAGSITALNSTAGAISLGALTASTGAALGNGAGGTAGFISVTNNAAGANLSTLALSTAGGAGGNGGNVTLASQADVTVTGALNTSGVVLAAGTRAGSNAGSVTLTGANRSITGAITASGSAANGINQAGGNAGAVSITGAGTLGTSTINAQTGAATGIGIGGAVGPITLTGSNATIGALSTAGNANGNGGAVSITTTGTLALAGANASNGAGGTVRGDVTLLAGGAITQSGAIMTRNLSATTASAGGAAITLSNTANDAITVNLQVKDGTTAAPGTNNANAAISYTDSNAVAVSSINSGTGGSAGDVTLLAGGALTQTGAIKAATLTATTANTTAITLTNTGNDVATVNLQARTGTVAAPGTVNANVAVQYTDVNGFAISGINNGASGTAGAVTLLAGGSITQTGAVNAATLNATLTGSTSALNLGTQTNNIAQLNAITAPGGFTLTNGNNNVIVNGNITATNNAVSIDAGTGAYTQNANIDISAGTGPITVIANTVAIVANAGGDALTTSGTLTLKPKAAGQAMSLAGAAAFDLSAAEFTAISTGATGPIVIGDTASTGVLTIGGAVNLTGKTLTLNAGSITDAGVQTITAQNVTLNANGQIGTSNVNGIDIAASNLSINTTGNANAFVRTGAINMGAGGSTLGSGTLDLTATGAVTQTVGTGNITAGTLNVKTLVDAGAAITLTNNANDAAVVNLKTRNLADTSNAAGVIQYSDATGFDVAAIATTSNATLSATGAVTQSGAIAATGLALTGTGGAYTLNDAGNAITTLAANTGSINYRQSGELFVGTVGVVGVATTGTARIETTGAASNLTLNNAVTSGATGDAVVLKAGSGNAAGVSTGGQLINNVGAGGIVASSGRYLAYSGNPDFTTEGVTGYAKRYNEDATFVPAGTASTFVYRIAPTLAVTVNAGTKVYDGLAPTLTFGTTGLIDGDTAGTALTGALSRTGGKNVLGGDAVTIGTLATQMGYGITYTGANYTITAKALTATTSAPNKVYNGNDTAAATLSVTAGLVGLETVTATGAATFNTKNVATANLVTVNSTTLADGTNGGLASNYSLAAGQTVAANITAKALTATASAASKTYNGNTTAAATLAIAPAGFVGTETVTATGAATFNTKDVATANLVTVNSTTLVDGTNGGLASNYSLAAGQTAAATISRANIANVSGITAANKIQDGTTVATLATGNAAFTGKFGADVLTVATANGAFDTPAVGTAKLVSISGISLGGTDAGNYNLISTTASTTADILRLGSGSGSGAASFPEGALASAINASLITANAQRDRDQRCAVASRDGGDSAADTGARRLSSDLICD